MLRLPQSATTASLVARLRAALGMTQGDLAKALSITRRTIGRWEGRRSAPSVTELRQLARMAHPKDAALAREIAMEGDTTLEELGVVATQHAVAVLPPPSPPARPFPPVGLMIDSILHVAARAVDPQAASTDPVSVAVAVLRVAIERARGLGLTVEELDDVLSPQSEAPSASGSATSGSVVRGRRR